MATANLTLHQVNGFLTACVVVVLVQTFLENAVKTVRDLASIDVCQRNATH